MSRYTPTNTNESLPSAAVPTSAPAAGLKKVALGGLTRKTDTKTAYPVLPDPRGEYAQIAQRIIERTAQLDALEGALETDKAELRQFATPFWFEQGRGKSEVPSSVSVHSSTGEVLVTFTSRYKTLPHEAPVAAVLGDQLAAWFKQSFALKIDGDKLPADHAEAIVVELRELFGRHNALDALSVTETIKPVPDFHTKRHVAFTPETNLALDQACPMVAMIKTKGRK